MLLQPGISISFTSTIGWVDILIIVILVIAFLRGRRAFVPSLVFVVALYIIRLFPNELLALVRAINDIIGPAAFITISR